MSKYVRTIWARGLTASDRGKTIQWSDDEGKFHQTTIVSVRYSHEQTMVASDESLVYGTVVFPDRYPINVID